MSQRNLVHRLLREAGPAGVDAHELIYIYGITQPAARVNELRNSGLDIETRDHGLAPDGRRRLCSYVLKGAPGRSIAPAPKPDDPPAPLAFDCGCVRAASGMGWASRCERHTTVPTPRTEVPPW